MQHLTFDDTVEYSTGKRPFIELFDWSVFLTAAMLVALGLISIYSATFDGKMSPYFIKQLQYTVIGFIVMGSITFMPERWISLSAYGIYGITLLLLVAVVVIGKTVYGSKSWLYLGSVGFQPSELAKIGTILALAEFISRKGVDLRTLRDLGTSVAIVAVPIALIMLEPDFGSASVFIALLLGVLLWAGVDLFMLFVLVAAPMTAISAFVGKTWFYVVAAIFSVWAVLFRRGIVLSIVAVSLIIGLGYSASYVYDVLKQHQKDRIQTFLNPESDPRGKGYHVIQSVMAVGSGGLTGKGFMHGTQTQLRYIPKQWTDFIFCVPTEEFGFVGGVLVIVLLGMVVFRAVTIASVARNKFSAITSIGVATLMLYHTLVNIGMAIGVFPVMGIPLPFLSAGGSSLIVNFTCIGLLLNAHRTRQSKVHG
ncbi:MAG: rod shape-determining protein RodA [Ignavibacteriae bacterium]|nr:rod shape-determining protein RodA [Ignavibacteriota bacterium]